MFLPPLQETGPCLVGQAGSQALSPADQSTQLAGDPLRYAFIPGTSSIIVTFKAGVYGPPAGDDQFVLGVGLLEAPIDL
jgi:hypothetical protein